MLDLNLIRIDGGTQSRAKLNNDVVADYAAAYQAGAQFPPVMVFYDGKDRWLADGFHRYHAAKQAGKTSMLEIIVLGTVREAKFYSWKANQEHGQRRTNEDKRSIVLAMLADEEAGQWSDNHIAKEYGFSPNFVGNMRRSLSSEDSEESKKRTFKTKHGTESTMQTGNIGTATKPSKPVEPVYVNEDKQDAIYILSEENDRLNDRLATVAMDASPEERAAAVETIETLRALVKTLTAELDAVKASRDGYMQTNKELMSQCASQRRQLDKFKK